MDKKNAAKGGKKMVSAPKTAPEQCPHCGCEDIDTNGEPETSRDLVHICMECGEQWEPNRN